MSKIIQNKIQMFYLWEYNRVHGKENLSANANHALAAQGLLGNLYTNDMMSEIPPTATEVSGRGATLLSADGAVGLQTVVIECYESTLQVLFMTIIIRRFHCNSAQLLLSRYTMASMQPTQLLCPGSRRYSLSMLPYSTAPDSSIGQGNPRIYYILLYSTVLEPSTLDKQT
ncbi:hypothetical protein UY3_11824 [Chelonia mydas]|uniref:Uncharacterized protein n=1 Tax=Chelonia mydas TaxID=8469 RepID=M7BSE0_CHEMY|nr:hypothetical protein UY3_11824 [Chelonia mydas]